VAESVASLLEPLELSEPSEPVRSGQLSPVVPSSVLEPDEPEPELALALALGVADGSAAKTLAAPHVVSSPATARPAIAAFRPDRDLGGASATGIVGSCVGSMCISFHAFAKERRSPPSGRRLGGSWEPGLGVTDSV
jgi:hypothetical protein